RRARTTGGRGRAGRGRDRPAGRPGGPRPLRRPRPAAGGHLAHAAADGRHGGRGLPGAGRVAGRGPEPAGRGRTVRVRRRRRWPAPRRLVPHLLITAVAAATVAGLAVRPDFAVPEGTASHVVIAGVVGLRWDDVDPAVTPNLWRLAERGAIGALAVRSAHRPTCPADGWLTLGAGNWAGHPAPRQGGTCPPVNITIEPSGAGGAHLPEQEEVVRDNRWRLPYGAVPGALAGAVECTTAIGEGGALAAARTYGRVDRYVPRMPAQARALTALLARC